MHVPTPRLSALDLMPQLIGAGVAPGQSEMRIAPFTRAPRRILGVRPAKPGDEARSMAILDDTADLVTLSPLTLHPDAGRTIIRPFVPQDPADYLDPRRSRPQRIADRVLGLSDSDVGGALGRLIATMATRIRDPQGLLMKRFAEVNGSAFRECAVGDERKQLIAAYFCAEYSFEAAALFNPSMIRHLKQPVLPDGRAQFVIALRGVGEGHVSSVTFRTGRWSAATGFEIDTPSEEGEIL